MASASPAQLVCVCVCSALLLSRSISIDTITPTHPPTVIPITQSHSVLLVTMRGAIPQTRPDLYCSPDLLTVLLLTMFPLPFCSGCAPL